MPSLRGKGFGGLSYEEQINQCVNILELDDSVEEKTLDLFREQACGPREEEFINPFSHRYTQEEVVAAFLRVASILEGQPVRSNKLAHLFDINRDDIINIKREIVRELPMNNLTASVEDYAVYLCDRLDVEEEEKKIVEEVASRIEDCPDIVGKAPTTVGCSIVAQVTSVAKNRIADEAEITTTAVRRQDDVVQRVMDRVSEPA